MKDLFSGLRLVVLCLTVAFTGACTGPTSSNSTSASTSSSGTTTTTSSSTDTVTNPAGLTWVTPTAVPSLTITGDSSPTTTTNDGSSNFFKVTTYGAVADGSTDNTTAIQAALTAAGTAASSTTPSIVVIPAASSPYLCGPITLSSYVYLKVETGATLKMLPMTAYAAKYSVTLGTTGSSTKENFITNASSGETTLGIYGGGVIDGNGGNGSSVYSTFKADTTSWWGYYLTNESNSGFSDPRPRMVYFTLCSNVLIENVTIQNSPSMHIMTSGGSNIVLSYVTVQAPAESTASGDGGTTGDSPNTDGFDPGGNSTSNACTNIWVDHCSFDTGDDCIAVKAASGAVSNMYVTNSTFKHGHGLSLGGQTTYGVTNLVVDSCTFTDTQYGIKIKSPRGTGGDCNALQYSNLTMTNVGYPIWFVAYYPDSTIPSASTADSTSYTWSQDGTPWYNNILVYNLTATGATGAGDIIGVYEKPFTNIVLQGVSIDAGTSGKGLTVRDATVYASKTSSLVASTLETGGVVTAY